MNISFGLAEINSFREGLLVGYIRWGVVISTTEAIICHYYANQRKLYCWFRWEVLHYREFITLLKQNIINDICQDIPLVLWRPF